MSDEEVKMLVDYLDQFTETMRYAVFTKGNSEIKVILDEWVTLPNERRLTRNMYLLKKAGFKTDREGDLNLLNYFDKAYNFYAF